MFHIILHFIVPLLWVLAFRWNADFKTKLTCYIVLVSTMFVDLDHLLADPVYDPLRCSIGFHPLHGLWLIAAYCLLALLPKTRLVGAGLLIHMALDAVDCYTNQGIWFHGQ